MVGNNGKNLLMIFTIYNDIVDIVAFEKMDKHEMVSSRGSFTGAEESPGSHSAEMPVVFVPFARVGSRTSSTDGGEIKLSPSGYAENNLKVPQGRDFSGNGKGGTGKPHERATQIKVGASSCGK